MKRALRELAVIVLGVLIALFAENAWRGHVERGEADRYLLRLEEELAAARQDLEADLGWAELVCNSAGRVLAHVRGEAGVDDLDATGLLNHAIAASIQRIPAIQRATYDDLVATGSLGLISDPRLREAIVRTYAYRDVMEVFRPASRGALWLNVVEVIPGERVRGFIDCVAEPARTQLSTEAEGCFANPVSTNPAALFAELVRAGDFERNLAEREYTGCGFVGQVQRYHSRLDQLDSLLGEAEAS